MLRPLILSLIDLCWRLRRYPGFASGKNHNRSKANKSNAHCKQLAQQNIQAAYAADFTVIELWQLARNCVRQRDWFVTIRSSQTVTGPNRPNAPSLKRARKVNHLCVSGIRRGT